MLMKRAHTPPLGAVILLFAGCGPQPEPATPPAQPPPPVATAPATPACTEAPGACGVGRACVAGECRAARSISAEGAAVCAVVAGKVACWGDNGTGVIDAGPHGPRPTPVVVAGLADAAQVRLGPRFGCALTTAGKVACFREGIVRELPLLSDIADLAIRDEVVLALRKSGELVGVSLGRNAKDMEPAETPKITDGVQISAGSDHACVVQKSGEVTCWGNPSETGSGKDVSDLGWEAREAMAKEPVHPQGLKDVVQVSAGDSHTCALLKSRKVMCWGDNWSGELGDGTTDRRNAPVAVQLLDDALEVTVGHNHTCARRPAGKVVCWGDDSSGQLGSGPGSSRGIVEVRDLGDAEAITAAQAVTCAARAGGGVSCWGNASRGRIGNGTLSDYPTPQPVKGLSGVAHLALADRLSCALDAQKQLQCWGAPGYRSEEEKEHRSFAPTPLPGLTGVTSVTGKDGGLCAVDGGGATYCGYTSSFLKAGKVKPLDLKGLKAIQSTGSAGFGLLSSGQVFLWNDPEHLQKINVNGLADGVSVASTGLAVCAVRRSGKVGCAGYSYKTFAKQDPLKPTNAVDVPDLKDAVHIAGDAGTMCVIKKTGAVSCFSTYRVPSPVDPKKEKEKAKEKAREKEKPRPIEAKALEGLDDVTALAAGGGQFCAVKKDATLWCWGSNRNGELGRGDYVSSEKPAPVPGLTDVAEVALAGGHVCALKKGGEVLCWGKSSSDEAGQPAPAYARSPVPVALPGAAP